MKQPLYIVRNLPDKHEEVVNCAIVTQNKAFLENPILNEEQGKVEMQMITNLYSFMFRIPRNLTVSDMGNKEQYGYRCKLKSDSQEHPISISNQSKILRELKHKNTQTQKETQA